VNNILKIPYIKSEIFNAEEIKAAINKLKQYDEDFSNTTMEL